MGVTSPQILTKQPSESVSFSMDFGSILAADETISSISSVSSELVGGGSSNLTIGAASISGEEVQFTISGGTHAKRYRIEVTIVTSGGNTREGDGILKVRDH